MDQERSAQIIDGPVESSLVRGGDNFYPTAYWCAACDSEMELKKVKIGTKG